MPIENNDHESLTSNLTIDPALLEELHQIESETRETRQRFRAVYRNKPNGLGEREEEIFYITPEYDPVLERNVIYWRQIEETFENALYIWNKHNVVYFNQDLDNRNLLPLRINTILEVILDVIIDDPIYGYEDNRVPTDQHVTTKNHDIINNDTASLAIETLLNSLETAQGNTPEPDDLSTLQSQSREYGRGLTLTKAERGSAQSQTDVGIIYLAFMENYSMSMKWLLKAADQGNSFAQQCIGYIYVVGYGVSKDLSIALEWAMKAAEQGDPVGQNLVGVIYTEGIKSGIRGKESYNIVMDWHMKSGNQGYPGAQRNVANLYVRGYGVPKDYSKALEWFLKAVKQGHSLSHNDIGAFYYEGVGVPKNPSKALEWYQRAASQGDTYSQNNIGAMYQDAIISPQDNEMAMKWYLKSANQGNPAAQTNLGHMYYNGDGVPQDYSKALCWFQKAAESCDADAQMNMGVLYHDGTAVEMDRDKAMEWYLKAANQGCMLAKANIGILHQYHREYTEALEWFTEAANEGDADSMYRIGEIYSFYYDKEHRDLAKAFEWYTKAAENGFVSGQRSLGDMYLHGEGVSQDNNKAMEWYLKAARQGDASSNYKVGCLFYHGSVPLDYDNAFKYYLTAAGEDSGYVGYCCQVAQCYVDGHGTPVDFARAKEWWAKAGSRNTKIKETVSVEKKRIHL